MKIIDCEIKGNSVMFYLGDDKDKDYWGDDWDDTPYEHNCGEVYHEYIKDTKVVHFPFDSLVLEPCDGVVNSNYCREDFKKGKVPCVIVVPKDVINGDWHDSFDYWAAVNDPRIKKYYFEDKLEVLDNVGEEETVISSVTSLLFELRDNVVFSNTKRNESEYKEALDKAIKCVEIVENIKKI